MPKDKQPTHTEIRAVPDGYTGDTVAITLPAMVEENISFADRTVKVKFGKCHPDAIFHCVRLGFRRFLNEGGSVKTKTDKGKKRPEAEILADKLTGLDEHIDQLKTGKIRTRSSERLDEVFKAMRDLLGKHRKESPNKIAAQFKTRADVITKYGDTWAGLLEQRAVKAVKFMAEMAEMEDAA